MTDEPRDAGDGAAPFIPVIMAGGQGQRFWPLSTADRPKQFLDLERRGRTMIQATFDRLLPLAHVPERIYVATASRYVELAREQLPDLPGSNVIVEPTGRDSAPAVALACLAIQERLGDVTLGFFSSDHRIGDEAAFQAAVRAAIVLAEQESGLVTLGITPTRAATGYGYIELGARVGAGFRVRRFIEKPDAATAVTYLRSGGFAWNAGIFVWRCDVILRELDAFAGDIMEPLRRAITERSLAQVFPTLTKRSIDYAVMEHTERALVVPVDCGWDDVGDWLALERVLAGPRHAVDGNVAVGRYVPLEAGGNFVFSEGEDARIVTVGVHDLVVVKRGDAVLVVAKAQLERLKQLVAEGRLD
jgi:mannose-1-phosphate guanylyltransferase